MIKVCRHEISTLAPPFKIHHGKLCVPAPYMDESWASGDLSYGNVESVLSILLEIEADVFFRYLTAPRGRFHIT